MRDEPAIEAQLAQLSIAEQEVDDQQRDNPTVAKDRLDVEMAKTQAQFLPQTDQGEQLLTQDQPGKGGEPLILEPKGWQMLGFMDCVGFATLHRRRSPFALIEMVCAFNFTVNGRPLFCYRHFLRVRKWLKLGVVEVHRWWDLATDRKLLSNATITAFPAR